jgi:catechol 2,3-dioxygenase-like lactoylglutathione lyase family enzyme
MNPIRPLGVGEVVVRVADLRRSIAFYRDILGFQLIRVLHDAIAFMRVADGVEGPTQIIVKLCVSWPGHAATGDENGLPLRPASYPSPVSRRSDSARVPGGRSPRRDWAAGADRRRCLIGPPGNRIRYPLPGMADDERMTPTLIGSIERTLGINTGFPSI